MALLSWLWLCPEHHSRLCERLSEGFPDQLYPVGIFTEISKLLLEPREGIRNRSYLSLSCALSYIALGDVGGGHVMLENHLMLTQAWMSAETHGAPEGCSEPEVHEAEVNSAHFPSFLLIKTII